MKHNVEIARLLLNFGADVNAKSSLLFTPIELAASNRLYD
jgi:ankyrin repeat protein